MINYMFQDTVHQPSYDLMTDIIQILLIDVNIWVCYGLDNSQT